MKEIRTILNIAASKERSNEKFAIAQVVNVEGSSYRRDGARMIVFESGVFEGGISGGCLEGDALKRSQLAILKQKASLITYDTSKEQEIGISLGCNGIIDVLMTPITKESSTLKILSKCLLGRTSHIIVTITSIDTEIESLQLGSCFYYDSSLKDIVGLANSGFKTFLLQQIREVEEKSRSGKYHFQSDELNASAYIELLPPRIHLAIFGDNYDIYPMIHLSKVLDWDISLIGNMQKLQKEQIQSVSNIFHKSYQERPQIDQRTAVILMAHDFKTDFHNLQEVLNSPSPYIAALGPKKRFEKMINECKKLGVDLSENDLERIHAPSGLEIGATTPEEIALSIFAEILSVFSGKDGGMLKFKIGPIHER